MLAFVNPIFLLDLSHATQFTDIIVNGRRSGDYRRLVALDKSRNVAGTGTDKAIQVGLWDTHWTRRVSIVADKCMCWSRFNFENMLRIVLGVALRTP